MRERLETDISSDIRAMAAVSEQIGLFFAAQHDLRPNDFRALMHIMVADMEGRPLTAGELARLLGTSSAAMTYLVERMIESGHIRRESDAADRRKVILRYAEHGMEVARGFFTPLGVRTREALAGFPDADLDTAHRVFVALIEAMRTHYKDLGSAS
ncbi:MarR family winged helix-turn-helix transcriptional regulator [Antrihabitans sp. YC2-6]|uniref:MarR family winged helix-turn-helix transcriptional regulator n=1 Tax=Antrihabitans sp. YC2-6 TaxID=2799498 RepID=UPI0018F76062|nr:MarR family winged helix-turn-helix transcriptional regulator [Antrihabitans sp. YC2-6]MBJ8343862.1 winged helix-turn-helix transcriptional regulator [Antrihabitans sp. YC2-6]